jgi:hypothetical protein
LAAIAVLLPRFHGLNEWACAGISFKMTGAAASHVFAGDFDPYAFHVLVPSFLAVLALASWALAPHGTKRSLCSVGGCSSSELHSAARARRCSNQT